MCLAGHGIIIANFPERVTSICKEPSPTDFAWSFQGVGTGLDFVTRRVNDEGEAPLTFGFALIQNFPPLKQINSGNIRRNI